MTERLRKALRQQGRACADLGSPFMGRLMPLLSERLQPGTPLTDRLFDWPGDLGPAGDSVPLRLAGALHALRLKGDAGLAAVYPPQEAAADALWSAVEDTMRREAGFIDRWIDSPPQTNEVRRAAALVAAGHLLTERFGLPIRMSELGASAGLNLMWDRFILTLGTHHYGEADGVLTLAPDWEGPLPPKARPRITERRGVDLRPLNPARDADRLRLLCYLWPDQPDRLDRTRAAMAVSEAPVDRGDAVDWLAGRLAPSEGQLHLIYHTVAWQYFPAERQQAGRAMIEAAGAEASADSPIAWVSMEADGRKPGAALTLRLWPGDKMIDLGRIDYHGRWVRWTGG